MPDRTTLHPYPAYKPSGVPWLDDMPEHWDVRRGGRLFRKMDRAVRNADEVITCFRDGTVTLRKNRRTEGFTESLKEIGYQGVRKGDLVIHQMDAFAGAVGVSDSDGKGTPVYSVCHPTQHADPFYYAHVVREMARNQWILALAKGIRERSTDFRYSEFAKQALPLPPLIEQAAIVRYLDYVDRRIRRYVAAKRKLIALLEEEKQAVVNRAVTRGLDPNVRLKPSGVEWLGDVPEHWEVRRLSQVSGILRGKFTHRPRNDPSLYDGPYPFIQTGDVAGASKLIMRYRQTLNEQGLAVSAMFPRGTLVMTIAANIGDVAILSFDACFPDSVVGFAPSKNVYRDHLYFLFRAMKREFLREAPVNTQGNLNIDRIGSRKVAIPPLHEQVAIIEYLDKTTADVDTAIARARRQIELVQEYRTRLIADVVTGKLDVRAAAAQLPDESDEEGPIDRDGLVLDNMDDGSSDVSQLLEEEQTMEREVTA